MLTPTNNATLKLPGFEGRNAEVSSDYKVPSPKANRKPII